MADRRVETVECEDGLELRVTREGYSSAPVVALLHGWAQDERAWTRVKDVMGRHVQVVSYSQRGHGETGRGSRPLSARQLAQDLHYVLQTPALGVADAETTVVGHCLGATVGRTYLTEVPEAMGRTRLVQVSPAHPKTPSDPERYDRAYAAVNNLANDTTGRQLIGRVLLGDRLDDLEALGLQDMAPEVLKDSFAAMYDDDSDFFDIIWQSNVPNLVVTGAQDHFTPPDDALVLADALGGRLEIVPGHNHLLPVTAPDIIGAHILNMAQGSFRRNG